MQTQLFDNAGRGRTFDILQQVRNQDYQDVAHEDLDHINGGIQRRFKIKPADYQQRFMSEEKIDEMKFFQKVNETIELSQNQELTKKKLIQLIKQLNDTTATDILPPVANPIDGEPIGMHQKFKLMTSEVKRDSSQKVLKQIRTLQKQQRLGPNFWQTKYKPTQLQNF